MCGQFPRTSCSSNSQTSVNRFYEPLPTSEITFIEFWVFGLSIDTIYSKIDNFRQLITKYHVGNPIGTVDTVKFTYVHNKSTTTYMLTYNYVTIQIAR